jgi:hypothetical protein
VFLIGGRAALAAQGGLGHGLKRLPSARPSVSSVLVRSKRAAACLTVLVALAACGDDDDGGEA